MGKESKAWLERLHTLWEQEQQTTHERFVEERKTRTLRERIEMGLALRDLWIEETDAAPGERTLLWLGTTHPQELEHLRVGPGAPVRLWWDDPDSEDAVAGVVTRRRAERLGVMISGEIPDRLEEGLFRLDRDEPQQTFLRGKRAIETFLQAPNDSDIAWMREIFCGVQEARFGPAQTLRFFDEGLNGPQREAVTHACCAKELALIHGPPGTGKTRTLIEVIRQAVARGDRVLATAASNTAVDNLAQRLVDAEVRAVRVGHPARVADALEAHTLDAKLEETEAYSLSRKWIIEANALRKRVASRAARKAIKRDERRELLAEARRLMRDARQQRRGAQDMILSQASVICATAAGSDTALLGEQEFDLVVLDEATQATDPIALVALGRARRVVLAGDPCQLPPTVIDLQAERDGLGSTLFERLAAQEDTPLVRMLSVQYRMHETIMAFPSQSMYEGKLQAADAVATHRLEDLPGVADDPLRTEPFLFIDTAGKGWDEVQSEEDPSTRNPDQAERTAAEARRILARGLPPTDLAVITPYDAQVRLLRTLLEDEVRAGLEIGSVDGFQGREKEAILLDLVRSNDQHEIGFLKDVRRMNVALTRARRFLLVLADSATLGGHTYYDAFFESTERNNAWMSAWDDDAPPFE